MDEGVATVTAPVSAHRVASDREAAVELVDCLELNGERPSRLCVEGHPSFARQNVPVLAAPEEEPTGDGLYSGPGMA